MLRILRKMSDSRQPEEDVGGHLHHLGARQNWKRSRQGGNGGRETGLRLKVQKDAPFILLPFTRSIPGLCVLLKLLSQKLLVE